MADKKANLSQISKTELAEQYSRLKLKDKKSKQEAKLAAEAFIADLITVGSGAGMGALMGNLVGNTDLSQAALAQAQQEDPEATEADLIAANTQFFGIDYDLGISGLAAGLALSGYAGKMGGVVRAVGVGGLTGWAARKAFFAMVERAEKDNENASGGWPSFRYGYGQQ